MRSRNLLDLIDRKLSRVTSSGEFIPEMDGLRFIAITMVIFHHLMAGYLKNTQRFGPVKLPDDWWRLYGRSWAVHVIAHWYMGVYLFFVISGFILAVPFARKYLLSLPAPSLKSYYLRRLTRIEPPYFLNLTFAFILICLTKVGWPVFAPHFLASLFYLHGLTYATASWVNGVAWSLEVEVQFYLVVPLLAMVFRIRRDIARRAILTGATAGFALCSQLYMPGSGSRLYLSLFNYLHYFLAGFLLADLFVTGCLRIEKKNHRWDLMAVSSAAALLAIPVLVPKAAWLLPFVMLAFYWAAFRGRISNRVITLRPIVLIGGICYTTYLYHTLVIEFVDRFAHPFLSTMHPVSIDVLIYAAFQLPVIWTFCACLFCYTEKPFMRHIKRTPVLPSTEAVGVAA